ncbi:hypothetical protein CHS0354_027127, partial [Potamilus streckersoni]
MPRDCAELMDHGTIPFMFEVILKDSTDMVNNLSKVILELNDITDPSQLELQKAEIEIVVSILDKIVGINTSGDVHGSFQVQE